MWHCASFAATVAPVVTRRPSSACSETSVIRVIRRSRFRRPGAPPQALGAALRSGGYALVSTQHYGGVRGSAAATERAAYEAGALARERVGQGRRFIIRDRDDLRSVGPCCPDNLPLPSPLTRGNHEKRAPATTLGGRSTGGTAAVGRWCGLDASAAGSGRAWTDAWTLVGPC